VTTFLRRQETVSGRLIIAQPETDRHHNDALNRLAPRRAGTKRQCQTAVIAASSSAS
jgi:hypothetical protein